MFTSNLRLVPWKNREAWMKVYEDAYSQDSDRQAKACQTMELWLVLRNDVPPGVECTLNILSAIQQENQEKPRQLQLILSTAVLRVVNMLCDNARQTGKETIYSIAKYYNLPDWIVNLRHDVSHGLALPDLSSLKRAAVFLLAWLKDYYWEIEKEEMKDIVLKRSRYDVCKDSVDFYMTLYIDLSDQLLKSGNIKLTKLKNEMLKLRIFEMNEKQGFKSAIECVPWVVHGKESYAQELPLDEVYEMKLSQLIKFTLRFVKDYVVKIDFWEVDVLPFILNCFLKHFKINKCIVKEIWDPVIEKLNKWHVLGRLLKYLCLPDNLKDDGLTELFTEICRALVKRYHVDLLKGKLSSVSISPQDADEEVWVGKAMLRKNLAVPIETGEMEVLSKLFNIVEKKQLDLKVVVRLSAPINYVTDSCLAVGIIKTLVLHPDKYTLSNLKYLLQLGQPEFPEAKKKELNDLLLIRLGQKVSSKSSLLNKDKIKTVEDLLKGENQFPSQNSEVKKTSVNLTNNVELLQSESQIVRSAWNFSKYPLGVSPWETEGVEYYHKPYNNEISPSYVFPVCKRPRLSDQV